MPDLNFDGAVEVYSIVWCARKTLGVTISPNGAVTVRVPYNTSQTRITDFAERMKPWIFKHLARYRKLCPRRDFVTGEPVPYMGKKYKLKVLEDGTEALPELRGGCLYVRVERGLRQEARREAVKQTLIGWYEARARQIMPERLRELAARLGVYPEAVKVKRQVRRWGSCTARGVINLNWQLVMAPPEVIDYVIVHELCHLGIHGHQRKFWECVAWRAPDYKKPKTWLKMYGHTLGFLSD